MRFKWILLTGVFVLLLYGCLGPVNGLPTVSLISPYDGQEVAVLASDKAVTLKSTATDPEGRSLTFDVYMGTSSTNLSKIATVNEPEYTVNNLTQGVVFCG